MLGAQIDANLLDFYPEVMVLRYEL